MGATPAGAIPVAAARAFPEGSAGGGRERAEQRAGRIGGEVRRVEATVARVPAFLEHPEPQADGERRAPLLRADPRACRQRERDGAVLHPVGSQQADLPAPDRRRGQRRERTVREQDVRLRPREQGIREPLCSGARRSERAAEREEEGGRMTPVFGDPAEDARRRAEAILRAHAWPAPLLSALGRLRADGHHAHLVGGSVRDVLLRREMKGPWDVATSRTPEQVRECFAKVEPIGERHGTVLVLEPSLQAEVTTFRREGEYADARHPDQVWFTTDPLADLARRDLTVNALAFDPATGVLLDPHDGAHDLERKCLRAVGDPVARFREDALRPLRVARFAAVLGMTPDDATRAALGSALDRSAALALERVRSELERMLTAPRPSEGLELLREAGLLDLWLPELAACRGVPQNRFHAYDVYFHSLYSCDSAPADKPVVRWAALLHDIGKPATREIRDGDATFYQHQFVGAELADVLLERLRFPHRERAAIVHLVREHMFDYRPEWGDSAVRRWLQRVTLDSVADLFDLRLADNLGNGLKQGFPTYLDEFAARIERIVTARDALTVADLALGGQEVMRILGIGPGREVGEALAELLEQVIEHPDRNTPERLSAALAERRARGDAPHA